MNKLSQTKRLDTEGPWLTRVRKQPFRYLVILLFLINITLIAASIGLWISAAVQDLFITADFTNSYTAFMMVRRGDGGNLYDFDLQAKYQQDILGGRTFEGGLLPYLNPPFIALFLSFFALVPVNVAFYLWTLVQLCLLIWVLVSLNRAFSHWNKSERMLMITTILAFWPLTNTFLLGQYSLFLLVGLLQLYISIKNQRLLPAGLWLVLLTIKPHSIFVTGMVSLNKRYWHVALTAAISCLVIFIVTSLFLGIQPWVQYANSLLTQMGSFKGQLGAHPNMELTVRGLLTSILGNARGQLVNLLSLVFLVVGMGFVWNLWRKGISQGNSYFSLYFAFTVLLSAILSLHLNGYDVIILVLPAVLFYDYLRQHAYPTKAFSIFILISPLIFFIFAFSNYNLFGFLRPPLAMMLIFLGWVIKYLIQSFQEEKLHPIADTKSATLA